MSNEMKDVDKKKKKLETIVWFHKLHYNIIRFEKANTRTLSQGTSNIIEVISSKHALIDLIFTFNKYTLIDLTFNVRT